MAFDYPEDLHYTDTHEYARVDEEEKLVTIGVTAFAVDQMGDVVFLELPDIGDSIEQGENFGTIESVKAVEDLKAPVSGAVVERNDALVESPEDIANDPYGEAWLIKVRADDLSELDEAMSAEEYAEQVEGDA